MPVPSAITDLSVTAASNSPAGADSVTSSTGPDEYLRALSAIVRREQAKAANVASASTVDLGAIADGSYVHITGTTTITAFGTVSAGVERVVVFDGILTLTHNATSLILPGGANITTAAGDAFRFRSEGSGNWRCVGYVPSVGNLRLSGGSLTGALNEARATVASHATTADIWGAAGNQIDFTGTATVTDFPDAPQAGARRRLIAAGACTITNNANITVQGGANYTCAAGDIIEVEALTTTTFKATIHNDALVPTVVSQAAAEAGSSTVPYLWTPQRVAQAIAALGGASAFYDSGDQTITAAGSLTLAHGLGAAPSFVVALLHCSTAELNYSVGDYLYAGFLVGDAGSSSVSTGLSVVPDSTNLNVRFGSAVSLFFIPNKTTGVQTGITNASWRLVLRAFP